MKVYKVDQAKKQLASMSDECKQKFSDNFGANILATLFGSIPVAMGARLAMRLKWSSRNPHAGRMQLAVRMREMRCAIKIFLSSSPAEPADSMKTHYYLYTLGYRVVYPLSSVLSINLCLG